MAGRTSTSVKWSLLILLAGLSVLPAIQKAFRIFPSHSLDGYTEPNPSPQFSAASLFDGKFLPAISRHHDLSMGFHNELVRLFNQIDFTLFRVTNARNVVIGKQDFLYEKQYITAHTGEDFIGVRIIGDRVKQFRSAQEWLQREHGILFLVLLMPDKGTFYPEYIPDRYASRQKKNTNYEWYCRKMAQKGINFIDFNGWFRQMKDTSKLVLYPRTGIHWSSYGSYIAMDSLVRYLEARTGRSFPEPELIENPVSTSPRYPDNDVDRALNLFCQVPELPLAYPRATFRKPAGCKPFRALFIGDSFYFTWARAGYIGNVFANRDFWYYDHDVCYGTYHTGKKAADADISQMLANTDAIILLQTNAGYGELGYYFVDRMFSKLGM